MVDISVYYHGCMHGHGASNLQQLFAEMNTSEVNIRKAEKRRHIARAIFPAR
jgi:hypothetical protein